ncbi:MAG: LysM peptidoglycan-binding domain-containing protein [Candidatus Melainabacteria bacterium]
MVDAVSINPVMDVTITPPSVDSPPEVESSPPPPPMESDSVDISSDSVFKVDDSIDEGSILDSAEDVTPIENSNVETAGNIAIDDKEYTTTDNGDGTTTITDEEGNTATYEGTGVSISDGEFKDKNGNPVTLSKPEDQPPADPVTTTAPEDTAAAEAEAARDDAVLDETTRILLEEYSILPGDIKDGSRAVVDPTDDLQFHIDHWKDTVKNQPLSEVIQALKEARDLPGELTANTPTPAIGGAEPADVPDGAGQEAVTAAPAASSDYTIVSGDTLGEIAERNGTTVEALAAANGIADPNLIFAGDTLKIPGVDTPAQAAQPAATGAQAAAAKPAADPATAKAEFIAANESAFNAIGGSFVDINGRPDLIGELHGDNDLLVNKISQVQADGTIKTIFEIDPKTKQIINNEGLIDETLIETIDRNGDVFQNGENKSAAIREEEARKAAEAAAAADAAAAIAEEARKAAEKAASDKVSADAELGINQTGPQVTTFTPQTIFSAAIKLRVENPDLTFDINASNNTIVEKRNNSITHVYILEPNGELTKTTKQNAQRTMRI